MSNANCHSVPCPSICCKEKDASALQLQKTIGTPFVQICIEGYVTETDAIECHLTKTHLKTVEEIQKLQCCSLKLERQLACQIPHYLSKITHKSHIQYSGPVRARQASIQYDDCNGMTLNYDLFYVPSTNSVGK